LIADVPSVFLLINDNTAADSTQTALKSLKGDYLLYQNRNEAIRQYQTILKNYTGQEIEATIIAIG
jgi:hypothetical protein